MSRMTLPPLLIASLLLGACAASTVQVPIADGASETKEVQRLDCRQWDEKTKSLTVGLNFSVLFGAASAGPSVTSAETIGVKWDKSAQFIVAQYKELCNRFNAGAVSMPSYESRLGEIDQLYMEAQGIRQNADAAIRGHSKEAFGELDKETGGGGADPAQVASAIEGFYAKTAGGGGQ